METLTRQSIEKQSLSIFLRDLSYDIKINLKHMVEDLLESKKQSVKDTYQINKKKPKPLKKKELIILEQNNKRLKENIEDDMSRMDFYMKNLNLKEPFTNLKNIKTEEGINHYKLLLLNRFWKDKKKYMKFIIILFYELKDLKLEKENKKLILKIEKVLDKCDVKHFMMNQMGNMLEPLNNWNHKERVFDDWQKEVIQYIQNNESIIVKAPTSAGKSFIAMACGILHKKILYICPAKPVAYQVGSHFIYMGYKVHFLLENISHFSYSPQTNIFIGTPKEIEDNLPKIGNCFDYVVYDEIHNINRKEDGDIYENLIKLIPSNFLALSATIENIDFLMNNMVKINPRKNIHYIEYNQRFINQHRWIWKNEGLKRLHPLSVFNDINDRYSDNNLSFTPNDCSVLWDKIYSIFEDIDEDTNLLENCSPDEYFNESRLLTLDDCRDYELFIKRKMLEWSTDYPIEIQRIFNSFKDKPDEVANTDIIQFIREIKSRKMFPMLMFHTNEMESKNLFEKIYEYLNTKESEEYPYHYDILQKKDDLYQGYLKRREVHRDSIKVTSTNPEFVIKDKMDIFDKREKNDFITTMIEYYKTKVKDIYKNEEIDDKIKEIQEIKLLKEMNQFIINPDFNVQDVFSKHPDFIFTNTNKPMSSDTIRDVRNEIKCTLDIKISYESALFQMLKRGIGLYLENLPDEYNWQLQKLLSKKEIGIVISDRTLCLGIDLPVKTTCFLGINNPQFTREDYLQMSGRAGRRGKDTQGNIIFFGELDYLKLMRDGLPRIEGSTKPIYDNYKSLHHQLIRGDTPFKNMINPERKYIPIRNSTMGEEGRKILWALREYSNACYFILNLINIEKELFQFSETERPFVLLKKISSIIIDKEFKETEKEYKLKKIQDLIHINKYREYISVLLRLYNNIRKDRYLIIIKTSRILFNELNKMTFDKVI